MSRFLALASVVLLAGCVIEDRTPAGSRADEAEIRSVVASYYRGVDARALEPVRGLLWDSLQVITAESGVWRSIRGADAWVDSLAARRAALPAGLASVETLRFDVRQDGDIAAVWTVLRGAAGARVDHVLLARSRDGWRIVGVASAPRRGPD